MLKEVAELEQAIESIEMREEERQRLRTAAEGLVHLQQPEKHMARHRLVPIGFQAAEIVAAGHALFTIGIRFI